MHHLVVDCGAAALVMDDLQSKRATQDSLLEALKARIVKIKAEE